MSVDPEVFEALAREQQQRDHVARARALQIAVRISRRLEPDETARISVAIRRAIERKDAGHALSALAFIYAEIARLRVDDVTAGWMAHDMVLCAARALKDMDEKP